MLTHEAQHPEATMNETAFRPLRLSHHVVIATAVGLIAPFTGLAWPFALLTGLVIARDDLDRRAGIRVSARTRLIRLLAVTGGVLAMIVAGAVLGGIVAFLILALVVRSEQMTVDVSPTDQMIARLLLGIGAVVGFYVFGAVVGANVSLGFGT
jgi:hypothetical protein